MCAVGEIGVHVYDRTAGSEIQDFRVNKRRVLKGLLGPMWHIYDRWHAKPRTIR